jgi:hypothetical protein
MSISESDRSVSDLIDRWITSLAVAEAAAAGLEVVIHPEPAAGTSLPRPRRGRVRRNRRGRARRNIRKHEIAPDRHVEPQGDGEIDYKCVCEYLRDRGNPKPAKLLELLADRATATLQDIIKYVH